MTGKQTFSTAGSRKNKEKKSKKKNPTGKGRKGKSCGRGYLIAKQRLEHELTKIGWSGSSSELPAMMRSYNAKRGTFFKCPADVIRFFRIRL